jgi:tetratricopeptide (TPR) repeat protein
MKNRFSQIAISISQKTALVFLGLLLSLVLLEVGMRLGGFVLLSIQEYGNLQSIKQKGTYRILCLGESTTQGQYPHLLEQVLNQRNIGVRFSVTDKGKIGTETAFILSHVEAYLTEYHPDMVIAMMGINDWGKHIPFEAVAASGETPFVRCLRIYKLARFLGLHLLAKAKEMGLYKPDEKRRGSGIVQTFVPKTGLKETSDRPVLTAKSFKKVMRSDPMNDKVFVNFRNALRDQGEFQQAEKALKKAAEINPQNDDAYFGLARLYEWSNVDIAEVMFKKAIEVNPENHEARYALGFLYRRQGKFPQAEDTFRKAIEQSPQYDDAYVKGRMLRAMTSIYEEMGKTELATQFAEEANALISGPYAPATINNYHRLKDILDRKGIKLVCAEYPVRSVEPLKRIFEEDGGVIFVDNESVFKNALKKGGYNKYFMDMFGGDFGHCTQKGNMLLAENIADVILREVFNK